MFLNLKESLREMSQRVQSVFCVAGPRLSANNLAWDVPMEASSAATVFIIYFSKLLLWAPFLGEEIVH